MASIVQTGQSAKGSLSRTHRKSLRDVVHGEDSTDPAQELVQISQRSLGVGGWHLRIKLGNEKRVDLSAQQTLNLCDQRHGQENAEETGIQTVPQGRNKVGDHQAAEKAREQSVVRIKGLKGDFTP